MKKQKKRHLYKVLLALCGITIFVIYSCRKIDSTAAISTDLTSKFFQIKGTINPTVQKVYDKVKLDNERYHQINNLAHNEGLAIWDKAVIKTKKSKTVARSQQQRTADGGEEEIVLIPLVLENAENVNSFLAAKITDTIEVRLFSGNQYDEYAFGDDVPNTQMSADKLATEIIMLDNNVFGYTKFKLLDNRLFTKNDNTLNATGSFARISSFTSIDGCTVVPIYWDPDGDADLCDCSGNEVFDHFEWEDCPDNGGGSLGFGFGNGGLGGSLGGNGYTGGGGGSSGGLGWSPTPLDDNDPPTEDPCPKANESAKKMDSLFTKSKADSVLATVPNLATETKEQGFPIYKKISISLSNPQDTTITGYSCGTVQIGIDSAITINYTVNPYKFLAALFHTHPPKGNAAHSAKDIYETIDEALQNSHYQGTFVAAANGSQYALSVTNYAQATAFMATMPQNLNGHSWNESSDIGKAYSKAFDHYYKDVYFADPNSKNLSHEMAMAAVINQYNVGVTLAKKNTTGNFKPIVVKTSLDPRNPKKTQYTQECL